MVFVPHHDGYTILARDAFGFVVFIGWNVMRRQLVVWRAASVEISEAADFAFLKRNTAPQSPGVNTP